MMLSKKESLIVIQLSLVGTVTCAQMHWDCITKQVGVPMEKRSDTNMANGRSQKN
jgi:hypothetical protein